MCWICSLLLSTNNIFVSCCLHISFFYIGFELLWMVRWLQLGLSHLAGILYKSDIIVLYFSGLEAYIVVELIMHY